ncbi:hypothetical protein PBOR_22035 [Paenibacillus borealis]|uniref:N-acetyltransferase domain-containing protein n=1 Tax=Paenibacillus borealis TaxID=160799 RepID=A0A089LCV2_PAEBO|nr:hypothetical protein [Paenibacillus borealis]AIQ59326.1 hypothetical protein PBOR_22035 [Paenibacillus borealis]
MYLHKGKLVIRDAAIGDARLLCSWWNDGRIMAHAGFPHGIGTTEQEVRSKLQSGADPERQGRLILEISGVPVGEMSYRFRDITQLSSIPILRTPEHSMYMRNSASGKLKCERMRGQISLENGRVLSIMS